MSGTLTGDLLIGAATVAGADHALRAINPATGETLEPGFAMAGEGEVTRACELARDAFDAYRATDHETRARFLETIGENILALGDGLVERAMAESGLPQVRIQGERGRTVGQLRLFADVVRKGEWLDLRVDPALPERKPLPRSDLRLRQIPLGPVAVFGASNFPLAFSVAGGDTASALAAGCPVVVKGHPAHPGTSELVGRAIQKAVKDLGLPEGVFSLLPGGVDTGITLVKNPHIKAVGFTGSRGGGLALVALAAARPEPIPVYAEMSSVNPVFVLPGAIKARAEAIAKGFAASLTLGAGQFCTNPGLIFALEGPELDPFLEQVAAALSGHQPEAMLTPGIHKAFETGVKALAENPAVKVVAKGQPPAGVNRGQSVVFATDAKSFLADDRLGHEVFGASSVVVRCRDLDELLATANHVEGQLTATLQIEKDDMPVAARLVPVLERKAGRILVNGWPTGVEVCHAMVHGGPYPATSDSRTTSVGTLAIRRFLRPVCYQDMPAVLLPPELRDDALAKLPHLKDGVRA